MIISSRPPEVIGHFDSQELSPTAAAYHGDLLLAVAEGHATDIDPSHARFSQFGIVKRELEPLWSIVDQDFRDSHGIGPSEQVNHALTLSDDRKIPTRMFSKDKVDGQAAHIDLAFQSMTVSRYVTHTTNPTVFLLGEKWFVPFEGNRLPENRLLALAGLVFSKVINEAALASQSRHGLVYQPLPGEIVKIEGQVHASPERFTRGAKAGKLIVIDSYLPQ